MRTYYPAGERPAMLVTSKRWQPTLNTPALPGPWELERINERTATMRHRYIVGPCAFPVDDVKPLDPEPWIFPAANYRHGHPLADIRHATMSPLVPHYQPPVWRPRTLAQLIADGIVKES